MTATLLGMTFGQALCEHFGLTGKGVHDLEVVCDQDNLFAARLSIELTADDLAGIAKRMSAQMPVASAIKVGDTVALNSGGPDMAVVAMLSNGALMCEWGTETGISRSPFPPECLVKVKPPYASGGLLPEDATTAKVAASLSALADAVHRFNAVQELVARNTQRMSEQFDSVTEGGNAMRTRA